MLLVFVLPLLALLLLVLPPLVLLLVVVMLLVVLPLLATVLAPQLLVVKVLLVMLHHRQQARQHAGSCRWRCLGWAAQGCTQGCSLEACLVRLLVVLTALLLVLLTHSALPCPRVCLPGLLLWCFLLHLCGVRVLQQQQEERTPGWCGHPPQLLLLQTHGLLLVQALLLELTQGLLLVMLLLLVQAQGLPRMQLPGCQCWRHLAVLALLLQQQQEGKADQHPQQEHTAGGAQQLLVQPLVCRAPCPVVAALLLPAQQMPSLLLVLRSLLLHCRAVAARMAGV
jgi:hypothetical protein